MGLILDSSILIAGERRKETVKQVIQRIRSGVGEMEAAISAVSIVELTHGVYRAKTADDRERRKAFCEELARDMIVHSITCPIAQLAGRIEGEQADRGIAISFEDLLIGATALHLGFGVAILNVRHFERIPGLKIVPSLI
jgi:predicted nucleic acid-binding protein